MPSEARDVIAKALREKFTVKVKANKNANPLAAAHLPEPQWQESFLPMSAEKCADVALAALADAGFAVSGCSEGDAGPSDAEVRAAMAYVGGHREDRESRARRALSAAAAARAEHAEGEELPPIDEHLIPAVAGRDLLRAEEPE